MADAVIVSYDNDSGNIPILIVGRKPRGKAIEIINAFEGEEATTLYDKLTSRKENVNHGNN